jgi:hypothetical protein
MRPGGGPLGFWPRHDGHHIMHFFLAIYSLQQSIAVGLDFFIVFA